jgi:hypothetical protein
MSDPKTPQDNLCEHEFPEPLPSEVMEKLSCTKCGEKYFAVRWHLESRQSEEESRDPLKWKYSEDTMDIEQNIGVFCQSSTRMLDAIRSQQSRIAELETGLRKLLEMSYRVMGRLDDKSPVEMRNAVKLLS